MSMFRCTFEGGVPLIVEAENEKEARGRASYLAWKAMARLAVSYELARKRTNVVACEMVEEGSCGRP